MQDYLVESELGYFIVDLLLVLSDLLQEVEQEFVAKGNAVEVCCVWAGINKGKVYL